MSEPIVRLTGRRDMQWNEIEIEVPGLGVIAAFVTDDGDALTDPTFVWADDACDTVAAAMGEGPRA